MSAFPLPAIDKDNEPYWAAASRGELRFQYCYHDNRFWYPVGPVCPRCQRADYEWRDIGRTGQVACAVKYHKKYYETADVPYVVALVELADGVRLSANVVEADGTTLATTMPKPGTQVEIVFISPVERPDEGGSIKIPAVRAVA